MNGQVSNWNPGALLLGASTSTTCSCIGARTGMSVVATPQGDPGTGLSWVAWVSSNDTITIRLTAIIGLTPATLNWNVRIVP